MIKKTVYFLTLLMSISMYCQKNSFHKYQYILVPVKFDFFKDTDKYQTSSLTKFLFKKKGFKVFLSNEKLPTVLNNDRCLALFASVVDESSMLTIRTSIEIKDCFGKVLYRSKKGKSKSKDYKKGYQEAIRNAFDSMDDFEYNYDSSLLVNVESKQEAYTDNRSEDIAEILVKPISNALLIPELKENAVKLENISSSALPVLYAQAIESGFQLVNKKPEVVFLILRTSRKDVFMIKNKNGNFYKNGDNWLAEFYEGDRLVKKEYQVKF
jgi:hypothetical protein